MSVSKFFTWYTVRGVRITSAILFLLFFPQLLQPVGYCIDLNLNRNKKYILVQDIYGYENMKNIEKQ